MVRVGGVPPPLAGGGGKVGFFEILGRFDRDLSQKCFGLES